MREFECCICHKVVRERGNNPSPVNIEKGAVCCDQCNMSRVIPARLKEAIEKGEAGYEQR